MHSAFELVEHVSLRRISATVGYADVRIPGVHLKGLRVEETPGGLRVTPPATTDRQGRDWPCYALQPGTRELVEQRIAALWAAS